MDSLILKQELIVLHTALINYGADIEAEMAEEQDETFLAQEAGFIAAMNLFVQNLEIYLETGGLDVSFAQARASITKMTLDSLDLEKEAILHFAEGQLGINDDVLQQRLLLAAFEKFPDWIKTIDMGALEITPINGSIDVVVKGQGKPELGM